MYKVYEGKSIRSDITCFTDITSGLTYVRLFGGTKFAVMPAREAFAYFAFVGE